ncbi:hypothetical protein ABZ203_13595, partial [Streptomyces albidoflavus]
MRESDDRRARATTLPAPFAALAARAWDASQEYTSAATLCADSSAARPVSISFWSLRAVSRGASFWTLARSAPVKPGVRR